MPDSRPVVVAVDQGTSSTKAVAIDAAGAVVGWASVPVGVRHPGPGRVEQDPEEILDSVLAALTEAVRDVGDRVAAVGLSTQRESALLWDPVDGRALTPMLGWQDRSTARAAERLRADGAGERIRAVTGLPVDPMFSALKLQALLDGVDPDRVAARAGRIAGGTLDSFLLRRLTGTATAEAGNASRTQLLDLATAAWSAELLDVFRVPAAVLAPVVASDAASAPVTGVAALPPQVPVTAVLGDSHAALFGHGVRRAGDVKVTLGTGSSVMGLLDGHQAGGDGLATTIAWSIGGPRYAFEGNVLATGATLVWLAEVLGVEVGELVRIGLAAPDGGVDLVPAFGGLGAPWWDTGATALLAGFDLGTSRAAIARAAVESVPLQIEDVVAAAERASGTPIRALLVDGGPAAEDGFVQLLADLTGREVRRPDLSGLSALGAAHLAGVGAGVWTDDEVVALDRRPDRFTPDLPDAAARRDRWHAAVARSRSTPTPLDEEHPR